MEGTVPPRDENALRSRPKDDESLKEERIKKVPRAGLPASTIDAAMPQPTAGIVFDNSCRVIFNFMGRYFPSLELRP